MAADNLPRSAEEDASEMHELGDEIRYMFAQITELEEVGLYSDEVEGILQIIFGLLQHWSTFAARGEYRAPADVRANADIMAEQADLLTYLLPRRYGRLTIPLIDAMDHIDDFRRRILLACSAVPEDCRDEAED